MSDSTSAEFPDEIKIEYLMPNGFTSDAYVVREREDQDILRGTDKHTDARVVVRWTGEHWIQLPPFGDSRG